MRKSFLAITVISLLFVSSIFAAGPNNHAGNGNQQKPELYIQASPNQQPNLNLGGYNYAARFTLTAKDGSVGIDGAYFRFQGDIANIKDISLVSKYGEGISCGLMRLYNKEASFTLNLIILESRSLEVIVQLWATEQYQADQLSVTITDVQAHKYGTTSGKVKISGLPCKAPSLDVPVAVISLTVPARSTMDISLEDVPNYKPIAITAMFFDGRRIPVHGKKSQGFTMRNTSAIPFTFEIEVKGVGGINVLINGQCAIFYLVTNGRVYPLLMPPMPTEPALPVS